VTRDETFGRGGSPSRAADPEGNRESAEQSVVTGRPALTPANAEPSGTSLVHGADPTQQSVVVPGFNTPEVDRRRIKARARAARLGQDVLDDGRICYRIQDTRMALERRVERSGWRARFARRSGHAEIHSTPSAHAVHQRHRSLSKPHLVLGSAQIWTSPKLRRTKSPSVAPRRPPSRYRNRPSRRE
jgi:hypothetical protein